MNETTAALLLLLAVLAIAAVSSRGLAVVAALLAFAGFNFFFLPPVGTFAIAKRDDLVALFVLLAVSLIGSQLSHVARRRAQEALALAQQRNEAELARKAAAARAALVASLGHDLKTPLTALTVAAGNLGNRRRDRRDSALGRARARARRASPDRAPCGPAGGPPVPIGGWAGTSTSLAPGP